MSGIMMTCAGIVTVIVNDCVAAKAGLARVNRLMRMRVMVCFNMSAPLVIRKGRTNGKRGGT